MITVKLSRPADAEIFAEIYRPYVLYTGITFESDPPDAVEFLDRLLEVQKLYPFLTAFEDGQVIGYAYAGRYRKREAYSHSAETSIYIRQDRRGHGAGKLLYAGLDKCLYEQNVYKTFACISCPNPASVSFHESCGYTKVGTLKNSGFKLGNWYDTVWMEKALRKPDKTPDSFIPFPEIRERAEKFF